MKRIIRKRVVLVLLLSLCLSLTACGNGNSGDSGNDTGVTPTRIEGMLKEAYDNTDYTSYLGLWDGVVNEGEPEQKLIAELNEDGEAGLLRLTEIWCAMTGVPAIVIFEGGQSELLANVVAQIYAHLLQHPSRDPVGLAVYVELRYMAASLMLGEWFE